MRAERGGADKPTEVLLLGEARTSGTSHALTAARSQGPGVRGFRPCHPVMNGKGSGSPVSEACTIAEVPPNQSLQGWQSRATQLLSAGTPATSWHGRQLLWQPRMLSTNQQPLGLSSLSSIRHHVYLGHWGGKPDGKPCYFQTKYKWSARIWRGHECCLFRENSLRAN